MKLSYDEQVEIVAKAVHDNFPASFDWIDSRSLAAVAIAALAQQAQVIPVEEIRISPETIAAAEAAYNFDATIQPAEQSQPLTDDAVKDLAWRLQAAYHESGKDWNTAARCALGDHPLVQQAQPETDEPWKMSVAEGIRASKFLANERGIGGNAGADFVEAAVAAGVVVPHDRMAQQTQPEPECSQCGNTKNVGPEYHICRACAEPVTYYPENCAACKFIEQTRSQLAMAEKHGVHRDSCPHNQ